MTKTSHSKVKMFVTHHPTGAKISIDPRYIADLKQGKVIPIGQMETKDGRKYFSLEKICKRWDYDYESVMTMFSQYEIPVFSVMAPIYKDGSIDPNQILVFEEYILGIEKKLKIPHKKIKSTLLTIHAGH